MGASDSPNRSSALGTWPVTGLRLLRGGIAETTLHCVLAGGGIPEWHIGMKTRKQPAQGLVYAPIVHPDRSKRSL
jgi:hypothetical protein